MSHLTNESAYSVKRSNLWHCVTYFNMEKHIFPTEWQGVSHSTHSCNGVTGMGKAGLGTRFLH